jgi:hypothetical protein
MRHDVGTNGTGWAWFDNLQPAYTLDSRADVSNAVSPAIPEDVYLERRGFCRRGMERKYAFLAPHKFEPFVHMPEVAPKKLAVSSLLSGTILDMSIKIGTIFVSPDFYEVDPVAVRALLYFQYKGPLISISQACSLRGTAQQRFLCFVGTFCGTLIATMSIVLYDKQRYTQTQLVLGLISGLCGVLVGNVEVDRITLYSTVHLVASFLFVILGCVTQYVGIAPESLTVAISGIGLGCFVLYIVLRSVYVFWRRAHPQLIGSPPLKHRVLVSLAFVLVEAAAMLGTIGAFAATYWEFR